MDIRNLFTIGEMGGLFRINIRTLRYYDEIGLLKPEVVDERTGYRYYSARQFERMNTIKYLRTLNMPLDKIKAFFENRDTSVMEQILEEQLEETREQLSRLHSIERKLSNRLFQLHYAMTAPLERIERKTFPARPAAFLKKEISQGGKFGVSYPGAGKNQPASSCHVSGKGGSVHQQGGFAEQPISSLLRDFCPSGRGG